MPAPRRSRPAEGLAILLALVALGIGLALAVAMDLLGITAGGVFIALLILPLTVYLIASGRLEELTGPGGWRLKLRGVADQVVAGGAGTAGHLEVEPDTLQVFEKSSLEALRRIRQQIRELGGGPVALTLRTRETTYNAAGLAQYLRAMMAFDPDMSVIVVDPEGGFQASTTGQKLAAALGESPGNALAEDPDTDHAAAVVAALQEGDMGKLGDLLSTSTVAVRSGDTNIAALTKMMAEEIPSMIVIDDARRPLGIVRRDQIVARMMADLLAP
jgi:hypothetical protein